MSRGEQGEVLFGDNLAHLEALQRDPDVCGHVALVYLDPPFGTGRNFGQYDDRWADGRKALVASLAPRFEKLRTILSDDGSILVHLDHRVAHLVAVLLDDLFGAGARVATPAVAPGFRNEIIWTYGLGGSSSRVYPRKHDTILWYSKGTTWTFDPPRIPATSARMRGQMKKQPDVWWGPPALEADLCGACGALTPHSSSDPVTTTVSDVWDIPSINNLAKERAGYPTQKPLALLERFISAHTRKGDLVVDPYCGRGTTMVAAIKLGRRAIGIDRGEEATTIARERLARIGLPNGAPAAANRRH
ncbi:MAG: hypothetical protein NVS3B20_09390 [Polyangiales bacterium]